MRKHLKIAEFLTNLLDTQFSVIGVRFGIDPLLGLLPGIGDLISFVVSLYLIWIAQHLKVPSDKIAKMIQNIVIDLAIGFIPIIGDLSDVVYRANSKNFKILQAHIPPDIIEGEIITEDA